MMNEDIVSSLTVGLLVFGVGYIVLKLVPEMWKQQKEVFRDYHEEEDEHQPVIKVDARKKFCQQIKFAVRLKKQMRRFKQRKDATRNLEDSQM